MDEITLKVMIPLIKGEIKTLRVKDSDTEKVANDPTISLKGNDVAIYRRFREIYKETNGSIPEKINAVNQAVLEVFQSDVMVDQYNVIAERAVNMASADSLEQFEKSIGETFGIDIREKYGDKEKFAVLQRKVDKDGVQHGTEINTLNIDDIVEDNVRLIKKIPEEYYRYVHENIRDAFAEGSVVTSTEEGKETLASRLEKFVVDPNIKPESRDFIAQRIARDQMGKIYADIGRAQQAKAGIQLFRWQTSHDSRVSGNPSGLYPDAKISCYQIARQKTQYGEGIYEVDKGAKWGAESGLIPGKAHIQCRCQMIPLIEGVNYDSRTKKYKPDGV